MEERKYYHYIFAIYNRKFVLSNEDIKNNLTKLFYKTAQEKQFEIITLSILADHVHMLIEQKYNDSPSYIMKCVKGASSYGLFHHVYPNTNRFIYRKLWGRSYHCREVPVEELKGIEKYINNQIDRSGIDKRFSAVVKRSRGV